MSAQTILEPSPPHSHFFPAQQPFRSRRPRRKRFIAVLVLTFLLSIVLSAGVLVFSPAVLEAVSAVILKPQPGTIQWNGHDRITVVAMGLTQRTTEPARTDTLLVLDIDPARHRISQLSVPRDLWVDIPGYGQGKLAIAYELGGPKLAAYTLERALGIPVDYTMAMRFQGFMKLVDAMGGVDVNVPQELKDPTYPCLVGYDYCPIDIKPGWQHMDGATALEFVRERHAFAQQDLARVKDQQAFSEAVKRTLLSPKTWPRFPAILNAFKQAFITNMPLNDIPAIGMQYMLTPKSSLTHAYINLDNGLVQSSWSNDGQAILLPSNATGIPNLVHSLFSDPTLASEHASVAVLNGTSNSGAASAVQGTLHGLGFNTESTGNADRSSYRQSEVIVNTAVQGQVDYTARRLQRIMDAMLLHQRLPGQSAQIVVVVGSDFPASGS